MSFLLPRGTLAAIGNGTAFRRGRDFAAWVGVVPRQYSTGGKQKLFGMSKRGNFFHELQPKACICCRLNCLRYRSMPRLRDSTCRALL